MNKRYPTTESDIISIFWIRHMYQRLHYGHVWVIYANEKEMTMKERAKYNGKLADKLK